MVEPEMATLFRSKCAVFLFFFVVTVLSTTTTGDSTTHSIAFTHPNEHPDATIQHFKAPQVFGVAQGPTIVLDYHFGPVMTGRDDLIKMYVVYYGDFSDEQKKTLSHFFKSFWQGKSQELNRTTVGKWWRLTRRYVDLYNEPVGASLAYAGEEFDNYSLGKWLNQSDIQKLVLKSVKKFGADSRSMYLVLTSDDVGVERFCENVCGTQFYTFPSDATRNQMMPYAWIGNPAKQCPGLCAWPYARGGHLKQALIPPNGDAGIDGMIITVANLLAAMATNPYGSGYYRSDGLAAAGVCAGMYGYKASQGNPGELLMDESTKASFNVYGFRDYQFLLPFMWNPATFQCALQA